MVNFNSLINGFVITLETLINRNPSMTHYLKLDAAVQTKLVKTVDVVCCGYGDRIRTILKMSSLNHTTAINMGPCSNITDNIFNYLFPEIPTTYISKCNQNVNINGKYILTATKGINYNACIRSPNEGDGDINVYGNHKKLLNTLKKEKNKRIINELYSNVRTDINEYANKFLSSKYKIISWHIRFGNSRGKKGDIDFIKKKRSNVFGDNIDLYLNNTIPEIIKLAKLHTKTENFKIAIFTDTQKLQEKILKYSSIFFGRNDVLYSKYGHFFTFNKLKLNNAGKLCNIKWFVDPVIDMIIMGKSDMLISSNPSGFTIMPIIKLLDRNKPICLNKNNKFLCY